MVMLLSADGTPATGLVSTTLTVTYVRNSLGLVYTTPISNAGVALDAGSLTHLDNGVGEIGATGTPGLYRVDFPDAAFATGAADRVYLVVTGPTIVPATREVFLTQSDDRLSPWDELRASHTTAGTFGEGAASVQGNVTGSVASVTASVVTDAASRTASQADVSSLATSAALGTVGTNVGSILVDTAEIGTAGVGLTNLGGMSAGMTTQVRTEADSALDDTVVVRRATAQAGSATTITLDAGASGVTDFYKDMTVRIVSGAGAGQSRAVTLYNGTTKAATVAPAWKTNPSATSVFRILSNTATGCVLGDVLGNVQGDVQGGVLGSVATVTALGAGSIVAASYAADAITASAIATDAFGALELAADAAVEIADAVWDTLRSAHTAVGSFGEGVASVQGNVTGSAASVTGAVGSVTGNVGGNVSGSTGSVLGNVNGSVGSVVGSVGSVTGSVGSVVGSVGSVAAAVTVGTMQAGVIDAASIAAGAVTAAKFAAGAVDANALAADAAQKIADAMLATTVDTFNTADVALTTTASMRQAMSIMLSAVAGVTANSGALLKTPDGTSNRITATLLSNARTAMSLTPST